MTTSRVQLDLFGQFGALSALSAGATALRVSMPVSALSVVCLGATLPSDFHAVSAPVHIVGNVPCLPASAARLSLCLYSSGAGCSGGVWLWSFQDPATGAGKAWPLCSAHEEQV